MTDFSDLFHYQRFNEDRLREFLTGQKLYMSSPASFNDPWDCQPQFDVRNVSDVRYRRRLADYFQTLLDRNRQGVPNRHLNEVIEEIRRSPEAALAQIKVQSENIRKALARQWRLYCLTPHADNQLMWSHYGDSHRGIALRYSGASSWVRQASRVTYLTDYPLIDVLNSEDRAHQILLSKSAVWSYENEYRVLALEGDVAPSEARVVTDANFTMLPKGALSGVILGALASEETEKAVLAMVAKSELNLVVQRAVLFPDRYGLSLRDIR